MATGLGRYSFGFAQLYVVHERRVVRQHSSNLSERRKWPVARFPCIRGFLAMQAFALLYTFGSFTCSMDVVCSNKPVFVPDLLTRHDNPWHSQMVFSCLLWPYQTIETCRASGDRPQACRIGALTGHLPRRLGHLAAGLPATGYRGYQNSKLHGEHINPNMDYASIGFRMFFGHSIFSPYDS